jgi:ribosomal protein S18 acetylase RimI-like enzyme
MPTDVRDLPPMSTTCLTRLCPPITATPEDVVTLRPLRSGDCAAVLAVFAGLGARSRERRFLTAKPRLTARDLRQLTAVDDRDHVALVAEAGPEGRPIGVARFVRETHDDESADVAVAVVDAWQSRGVGTMLATALAERARRLGIRRFTLVTSVDNDGVRRLLERAPGPVVRFAGDEHTAEYAVSLVEDGRR